MKRVAILLVMLVAVVSGNININFANMLGDSSLLKPPPTPPPTPPPCTNITCKPYLSLRRALNAGHMRAAAKGLWSKSFLQNQMWPGFAYDTNCDPEAPLSFPPKEGAFAELLNRGIRLGFPGDSESLYNGDTNPPTGPKPDYYNAILDELKAFYGPIKTSWVLFNFTDLYGSLARRDFDWFVIAVNVRANTSYFGIGCAVSSELLLAVVRANDKYKTFNDLLAAGKDLKLGTFSWNIPNKLLALNATLVIFDGVSFTDRVKMLVDGKIDAIYGAAVMPSDVAGTPYKVDQFINIIIPLAYPQQIITPLD